MLRLFLKTAISCLLVLHSLTDQGSANSTHSAGITSNYFDSTNSIKPNNANVITKIKNLDSTIRNKRDTSKKQDTSNSVSSDDWREFCTPSNMTLNCFGGTVDVPILSQDGDYIIAGIFRIGKYTSKTKVNILCFNISKKVFLITKGNIK